MPSGSIEIAGLENLGTDDDDWSADSFGMRDSVKGGKAHKARKQNEVTQQQQQPPPRLRRSSIGMSRRPSIEMPRVSRRFSVGNAMTGMNRRVGVRRRNSIENQYASVETMKHSVDQTDQEFPMAADERGGGGLMGNDCLPSNVSYQDGYVDESLCMTDASWSQASFALYDRETSEGGMSEDSSGLDLSAHVRSRKALLARQKEINGENTKDLGYGEDLPKVVSTVNLGYEDDSNRPQMTAYHLGYGDDDSTSPQVTAQDLGYGDDSGRPQISAQDLGYGDDSGRPQLSAQDLGYGDDSGRPQLSAHDLGYGDDSSRPQLSAHDLGYGDDSGHAHLSAHDLGYGDDSGHAHLSAHDLGYDDPDYEDARRRISGPAEGGWQEAKQVSVIANYDSDDSELLGRTTGNNTRPQDLYGGTTTGHYLQGGAGVNDSERRESFASYANDSVVMTKVPRHKKEPKEKNKKRPMKKRRQSLGFDSDPSTGSEDLDPSYLANVVGYAPQATHNESIDSLDCLPQEESPPAETPKRTPSLSAFLESNSSHAENRKERRRKKDLGDNHSYANDSLGMAKARMKMKVTEKELQDDYDSGAEDASYANDSIAMSKAKKKLAMARERKWADGENERLAEATARMRNTALATDDDDDDTDEEEDYDYERQAMLRRKQKEKAAGEAAAKSVPSKQRMKKRRQSLGFDSDPETSGSEDLDSGYLANVLGYAIDTAPVVLNNPLRQAERRVSVDSYAADSVVMAQRKRSSTALGKDDDESSNEDDSEDERSIDEFSTDSETDLNADDSYAEDSVQQSKRRYSTNEKLISNQVPKKRSSMYSRSSRNNEEDEEEEEDNPLSYLGPYALNRHLPTHSAREGRQALRPSRSFHGISSTSQEEVPSLLSTS